MLFNQGGAEPVVAGRHRRVRREDNLTRDARHRLIEADSLFAHTAGYGFQNREAAVALVQVKHAGHNAQFLQCAKTSDAQQQLLTNANSAVSAIQSGGKFSIFGSVSFYVGVEQIQIAASYLYPPDFGPNRSTSGVNMHSYRFAIRADSGL